MGVVICLCFFLFICLLLGVVQQRGGELGSLERRTVHRKNRKGEYALQDFPCVLFQRPSESVHVVLASISRTQSRVG